MKKIAFFDFDGTITTKDTLLEFIKFCKGPLRFYLGFLINSPYLVAFKLKIISNQLAKEKVLSYFFGGERLDKFQERCDSFEKQTLQSLVRPKAITEIERLKKAGVSVVIVSASPRNWIAGWAASNQLGLIATELETTNNRITGKIIGRNCHGLEKIRRIREIYDLTEFEEIHAYGDSSADKPMLSLARFAHMKPFRN